MEAWVEDLIDGLLVPLGVAMPADDGERLQLETQPLRISDPPGWPEGQRAKWIEEIFDATVEFDVDGGGSRPRIREVTPMPGAEDEQVAVEVPLDVLLKAVKGREVVGFDGRYLRLG